MGLANEKQMSLGLFEHPNYSGDVFYGELEHDQIHGCLAVHVVFLQKHIHGLPTETDQKLLLSKIMIYFEKTEDLLEI